MTPYYSEGSFTTESREVAVSETWDSWANPQSMSNVVVENGVVMLEEFTGVTEPSSTVAHYDATAISGLNDGDPVSSWSDESGNGNDLSTSAAPTYRTSVLNGNPVVRFGGSHWMNAAIGSYTQPVTVIAVANHTGSGDGHVVSQNDDDASTWTLRAQGQSDWLGYAGSSVIGGANDGSHYLMSLVFDTTDSELRQDGSAVATGDIGSGNPTGISLGARRDQDNNFLEGDIAEVLWCDADLRATGELSGVESGLADKWGIAI